MGGTGGSAGAEPARGAVDEVVHGLGPRLRALRRRRGVTLAELSRSTGISTSTLSRLESGQRRPTLELVLLLARAHRVALDDLVGAPETGDPRIRMRPVTRWGMTVVPLSRRPGGLQAYKLLLPPAPEEVPEQRVHDGYDWLYVLTGRLRLLLGDADVVLAEGEAAEFDTRTPHGFANPGPGTAEVLALFGEAGERVHVRARARRGG
ncbi:XRE family transcriptional regulator [Kineococcus glutinatus]|uniref:XRE family transcriptional regulator n=1 Tax=Kineococcus glutinatus TaxID=1070872 RepID=A0ABP8VED0_9ACTN